MSIEFYLDLSCLLETYVTGKANDLLPRVKGLLKNRKYHTSNINVISIFIRALSFAYEYFHMILLDQDTCRPKAFILLLYSSNIYFS